MQSELLHTSPIPIFWKSSPLSLDSQYALCETFLIFIDRYKINIISVKLSASDLYSSESIFYGLFLHLSAFAKRALTTSKLTNGSPILLDYSLEELNIYFKSVDLYFPNLHSIQIFKNNLNLSFFQQETYL
jgi:hypothetical protein